MAKETNYKNIESRKAILIKEIDHAIKTAKFAQRTHKKLLEWHQLAYQHNDLGKAMAGIERDFGACFSKEDLVIKLAMSIADRCYDSACDFLKSIKQVFGPTIYLKVLEAYVVEDIDGFAPDLA